jgi:hypothetical protein
MGLDLFERCQGARLKSDISLDLSQHAEPSLDHYVSAADEVPQSPPWQMKN